MQNFAYSGVDARGHKSKGTLRARDEAELEERLRTTGVWLVEARRAPEEARGRTGRVRTTRRDLINFCTLMGFLTQVGIPLVQALEIASNDCDRPAFAQVIEEVKRSVESGFQLANALERFPRVFPPNFTHLIRAGEHSGSLPAAFAELKRYQEWLEQMSADVKQATIYPAVVLVATLLFVLILFTFVVPKFVALLTVAKATLPWPTRVVFGVSDFIKSSWWWVLGALIVVPAGVAIARRRSERFACAWERAWYSIPVIGDLSHMLVMSRFSQNLAILYRNGVSLIPALKLVEGLVDSPMVSRATIDIGKRIEEGETFSGAMRLHTVFPLLLLRMTLIGERTGQLDHALENVAAYYNLQVPQRLKRLFSLLEPALILFLVGVVGFVALAVFLPILSLMQSIR
jgi:type IV pilus assembly protein PilC